MTIADRLRAILVKDYKLEAGRLTPDARLEDLGLDSIDMAELIFNIEDEFHLVLGDAAVQLVTFGDLVDYINRLLAADDAAAGQAAAASAMHGSKTAP